ncbi:MAG TPA: NAD(P)-dependent oxidoreductase [Polyangia bacterium]|jgi:3-hydroxyisobutyrate dehydrogenase-like beta-hydroxyacid dehydrogenase|nr:NAD(P)-dependent oxidoreductase [Polyangia bacterium]
MANETTIAVVGLGRMGRQMAMRLAGAGFALRAWNRTRARADGLGAALVCASPREAAAGAAIVVTSLADDAAARAVVLGEEGVLAGLDERAVHVSTSTISPGLGRTLAEAHRARGRAFLASPVLGRPDAAGSGQLTLLLGGDDDAIARAQPALAALGRAQLRAGDAFQAQLTKVIANFMIAGTIELLAEATTLGEKGGIAPASLVRTLSSTVLSSPIVDGYGKRMAAREYQPAGFAVPLGLKDVELALSSGRELRVPLPAAGVVRDHLLGALARGRDGWDWTALASVVRENSGLDGEG